MNAELHDEAAEYVLGTLPADERARFAERLKGDAALREAVRDWQRRLAPLDETAANEAPRPEVWHAIEATTRGTAPVPGSPVDQAQPSNVIRLERRVRFWRGATVAAGALAAALAVVAVIDRQSLQPAPTGGRYVAVVDTPDHEPALIAEVNTATGVISIRRLTAEPPAGHSLELWHVAEGHQPRSLGILNASLNSQTIQDVASSGPVNGMIAVSVEPAGGSPSGAPTGPVVYTGRLIPVE